MLLLSPAHGQATHTIDPCAERIPLPPVDHKSSEFSAAPRVLSQSPSFSVQNRASSDRVLEKVPGIEGEGARPKRSADVSPRTKEGCLGSISGGKSLQESEGP